MCTRNLRIIGFVLCVGLLALFPASAAHAFATFATDDSLPGDSSGFSDLITNPNDYVSWDETSTGVIALTWKFGSGFTTDNRLRDQVRLAFQQWDHANTTADGATYSYERNSGSQNFGDLRSIAVHELGHVLGLHHPNQADAVNRNFGWNTTPPPDLVVQADQTNEVMRSWIPGGGYNQILGHDELDGYEYCYSPTATTTSNLNFTEVSSGSADIVVDAASLASSSWWALGGGSYAYRNAGDHHQGGRFVSGEVTFNTTSTKPIGYRAHMINWDFENPSGTKDTRAFKLETRGTNNTNPVFHYDGSASRHFNTLTTVSTGDVDHKDDLLHTWSNPDPGDFDPTDIIHVGLGLDVWDWTVESARVVHPDNSESVAPVLWSHDWNDVVTGVGAPAPAEPTPGQDPTYMPDYEFIRAQGIRLGAPKDTPVFINLLGVAVVDDMGLGLEDLNRATLNRLIKYEDFEFLRIPDRLKELDNGEEFHLVFDNPDPPGLENFYFLDRPDLMGRELFLYAQTRGPNNDMVIGNYVLLGTPPITGVPEPSTIVLAATGLLGLLACGWRRRRKAA